MQLPKAVIFDLDETLAISFQAPEPGMLDRLTALQAHLPVAIMTGAGFDRIINDVVTHLPKEPTNLVLFPNSSSQCFMYEGHAWKNIYSHLMNDEERAKIKDALNTALGEFEELSSAPVYGERIIDREAQIAFTAVGQEAPADVKATWDPTSEKRLRIARVLRDRLPEFDILIGGASTIDFTRKDTNKSYGVRWFADYLKTTPSELLYVGDALYPGGNDEVVLVTGIQARSVANPEDTEGVIDELLNLIDSSS
ncbi:MAG: HAD-IIB family hydrolase [Candidatus Pacebacteria bacterium]|nr:HAD-IIB family hydrolase [Candidatus Paceibacterota bacterium]